MNSGWQWQWFSDHLRSKHHFELWQALAWRAGARWQREHDEVETLRSERQRLKRELGEAQAEILRLRTELTAAYDHAGQVREEVRRAEAAERDRLQLEYDRIVTENVILRARLEGRA